METRTAEQTATMMQVEPQKEHHWLEKLVGEWTYETEAVMEPGSPPEKCRGAETVRSLGGLWILCEGRGEMPGGGEATTLMTLGYDVQKKRYIGTFVASMMTHLFVYDGALDASGKKLVLSTEGPSMAGNGKMALYRDTMELRSDDHRILTSQMLGDDGAWHQIMTANFRRKK